MPDEKPARPRGRKKAAPLGGNLLDNPAFAGADDVVGYSVFGQQDESSPLPAQQDTSPAAPPTDVAEPAAVESPDADRVEDTASSAATPAEDATNSHAREEGSSPSPNSVNAGGDDGPSKSTTKNPAKKPNSRRKSQETTPEPTDAHRAVAHSWTESTLDLMLGTRDWSSVPVRLTKGMAEKLTKRMVSDSAATGKRMTQAVYVDAAFRRHLPKSIEEQVALAAAYVRSGRVGTTGKQSTYRVGPDIAALVTSMPMDMKSAGRGRTAVHVFSAAVQRLLDELEEDGPLVWPQEDEEQ
ncbi:hypothetical protein [Streptomyces sp. B29(2018)]|uniref:hypothetical protein n=1 Tax=Streptomyces sp. B29(2018) TaxID=2485016 RepID=UPI000FD6B8BE|nr:hypothetical protein [Streptomyces sp. B29(2018)]